MKTWVILFGMIALSGCSFAPEYQRPPMYIPNSYKETGKWLHAKPSSAALDRGPWWEMYGDPVLNELEQKVVCGNQNLQLALARYEEARAILAEQRAALFPSVLGVFNLNRQGTSKNTANHPIVRTYTDILAFR